eukprot:scaffold104262_cov41-Prasinocladus_malaysianus.AAC.2
MAAVPEVAATPRSPSTGSGRSSNTSTQTPAAQDTNSRSTLPGGRFDGFDCDRNSPLRWSLGDLSRAEAHQKKLQQRFGGNALNIDPTQRA